jgi:ABC-type Fe3+/spermidine/putrescine transport system ATPase subunit
VALARALVSHPSVLLLDEPLSNLDANLRDQLRRELRQLHDRHGKTSIIVTHDQEEAAMLADIVAVINRGRLVQVGHPDDILERPTDRFVAGFVGYDNFVPGFIEEADNSELQFRLTGGDVIRLRNDRMRLQKGHAAVVGVRGTRISVASKSEPKPESYVEMRGRVTGIQSLGRWREMTIDCRGAVMTSRDLASNVEASWLDSDVYVRIPSDSPVFVEDAS